MWTRQVPVRMRAVLSVIGEAEKAESGSGEAHRVRGKMIGVGCAALGCLGERRPKITSDIVEYNGVSRHLHADKLRKYHVSVQEISARLCQSQFHTDSDEEAKIGNCSVIYDDDKDFGNWKLSILHPQSPNFCLVRKLILKN